jgi:hypothetical protein
MNQPSRLDIQKAKARLAAMERAAGDLAAELRMPAESRYDILRVIFEPNPSEPQARKDQPDKPNNSNSGLFP